MKKIIIFFVVGIFVGNTIQCAEITKTELETMETSAADPYEIYNWSPGKLQITIEGTRGPSPQLQEREFFFIDPDTITFAEINIRLLEDFPEIISKARDRIAKYSGQRALKQFQGKFELFTDPFFGKIRNTEQLKNSLKRGFTYFHITAY